MRTSPDANYVSRVDVCNFVLQCLSVAGVASTVQLSRVYAHRKEPLKRISSVLQYLQSREYIESRRMAHNEPNIYRLTYKARKPYGVRGIRFDGNIDHKLSVTQTYLDLGAPDYFIREYRQPFTWRDQRLTLSPDAVCRLGNEYYFIEVQRTPIETRRWALKRRNYARYFSSAAWHGVFNPKPRLLIVQYDNQRPSTIGIAEGYEMTVLRDTEVASWGSSEISERR